MNVKASKTVILNTAAIVALCGVSFSGMSALAAGTTATPKLSLSLDEASLRIDGVKGLKNSDNSFQMYASPFVRMKIQSYGVTVTADVDLRKFTSGSTLRQDFKHTISSLTAEAQVASGILKAGVSRVPFGPQKNAEQDLKTITGNGQDALTNMDERWLATYEFKIDEATTITATLFSSQASGSLTAPGNKVVARDLMDPNFGNADDISGAVTATRDLNAILKNLKASVSYALVRQDGIDNQHRVYGSLDYSYVIGQMTIDALASYTRIIQDNANDLQSFLVYAHAKFGDSPWGLYVQADRSDSIATGNATNRIEGGVDYSTELTSVNANMKWLVGVYSSDFTKSSAQVGVGTSLIFTTAAPATLYQIE